MSYQLDYFEVIKAIFLPVDIVFLLVAVGIPLFIIPVAWYATKTMPNKIYQGMILAPVLIIPIATLLFMGYSNVGSGWQLNDDKLQIKAWPVEETIDLATAQIALEETSGPWKPAWRTNGYGTAGLGTGWFILQNGQEAVVFYHQTPTKILVLQSGEQYYLLAHPGVEELYGKIVGQGVESPAQ